MTIINVEDITNENDTGIFDVLMEGIEKHIITQYEENRITGTDYANVYLGSIQAALAQAVQFGLQKDLTEAQIETVLADNLLKAKQLEISELERLAKQFELDNILPEQQIKLQEEIDLLQSQDSELLLNGVKQRLIMDEEIETANKQQELADVSIATSYTERILKDKEAAKLGLDNAMKIAEDERVSNTAFIYTPKYERV